jgi:hypothetical protein
MELAAQFSNTIAVAVAGVLVWFYLRGRFEQVDQRFDEMKQGLKEDVGLLRGDVGSIRGDVGSIRGELAGLRRDADRKFELLMAELYAMRSDLTHVALAVGARTRPEANPA